MMKLLRMNGLLAALFVMVIALTPECRAQEVFEDPEGKYTVTLPTGWLGIVNQDALGRNDVNIVFKVRENGALKLRRIENTDPNVEVMEYANKDEADRVRFAPGYTKIRMEKFLISAGKYGALLSYDYRRPAPNPLPDESITCGPMMERSTFCSSPGAGPYLAHFATRPI